MLLHEKEDVSKFKHKQRRQVGMTIKKLERNATILCAMGYYDVFCGFPVLKIQLRYDDIVDGKRERYQVIFFQFNKESELESCIDQVVS